MDISSLFITCVKTIFVCNKNIEESIKISNTCKLKERQTLFITKAQIIVQEIAKLYKLLLDNRQAYLNFLNYLPNKIHMTDVDRDKIDSISQSVINTCLKLIEELKEGIITSTNSQQCYEHYENIILLIQEYFNQVCKLYSEQKATRLKSSMERKTMFKLQSLVMQKETLKNNKNIIYNSEIDRYIEGTSSLKVQEINGDMNDTFYYEDKQLSIEDAQIFEAENAQLYHQLTTVAEEIKQIENKVVQITELQDIFAEKILVQDINLEHVLLTVTGSTENVKEANEEIRKAIQRNAGLRVWILFFLLVMSFTLIFLDWYNP